MRLQVGHGACEILDIRRKQTSSSLRKELGEQLRGERSSEKQLPTILLYDERGLKLFEEITYLEEYYLTNAEIEALNIHADSIAKEIPHGAQIIELGSGYATASLRAYIEIRPSCRIGSGYTLKTL